MPELIDLYMGAYAGRDSSRTQRLGWWRDRLADKALQDVTDDDVHSALEDLARRRASYYAGKDVDGKPIQKPKGRPISAATVNRYSTALAAVITWSIRKRIAPRGYVHPCRSVERRPESSGRTRFLSDAERDRLLEACRASTWPRLYLLVLMALTTGARKGELQGLTWQDVDLELATATVGRTKNGDPKVLPLVPAVLDALRPFIGNARERVFPAARRPTEPFSFEQKWLEAVKAAGVRNFRFHDLRHSCASMLAQNGATLLEIGDLLGHRQLAMTKRYSHLTVGHKAALVNRVLGSIR